MDASTDPPWRKSNVTRKSYQTKSSVPAKRGADAQEIAWVAGEDKFQLQQFKKRAVIRVKEGRARPIDWLAVTLRFIDSSRNFWDDDEEDSDLDIVDPEGVLEGLDDEQLLELEHEIEAYTKLEINEKNRDFWETMHIICKDRRQKSLGGAREARGVAAVSTDVEKMFSSKTFAELETLEKQISAKLTSHDQINVEYWEHLLSNLTSWKARAKLRKVSKSIIESQLQGLRKQQEEEAKALTSKLSTSLGDPSDADEIVIDPIDFKSLDPESALRVEAEDKALDLQEETQFLSKIANDRRRILKLGYVPLRRKQEPSTTDMTKFTPVSNDDFSQATTALYEREVARGVGEDEEIFTGEEDVASKNQHQWSDKYRPRKPRYFNRVQMGYEWNKYNQTHYDYDNPPPKVVQGYKFNVFYPDLIDRTIAPTYKIEREDGRKRGQSYAPAGEEDTCLIRFVSGPPYEDVAFRIVDKEWDYSAKRERGFKSSFDKGILQLHFQFKKRHYRK